MKIVRICFIMLLFVTRAGATPGNGSCMDYKFKLYEDSKTKVNETLALRVLREGAPVYAAPTGDTRLARAIHFGQVVDPLTLSSRSDRGRIQVRRPIDVQPLGWMERSDLLCRDQPLVANHLERKAFIRTKKAENGRSVPVRAYYGPAIDTCQLNGVSTCRSLSRFDLLFVFAEDPDSKRVLLAFDYRLIDQEAQLVGWVPEKQIAPWNTLFGLRPSDTVAETFMYRDPASAAARNRSEAYPLIGNKDGRWYSYPHHLPLLGRQRVNGQYVYKVAAPGTKVHIDDDPFRKNKAVGIAEALKGVDIFFLIDGTASLEDYIRMAANTASTLAEELITDAQGGHQGNHYRFGFRVYRDHYADTFSGCTAGMCEGLPLDRTDCGLERHIMSSNQAEFLKKIEHVHASSDDGDDYPELLFDGIGQAVTDMGGCKERLKVLIVIGDHGDHQESVPTALQKKLRDFASKFMVFFVQTPKTLNASKQALYDDAYGRFQSNARDILSLVYTGDSFEGRSMRRERKSALLNLSQPKETQETIKNIVAKHSSSRAVNEVVTAIRGGEALNVFLRKRMKKGDLPILFWERIYKKLCNSEDSKLGRQCTQQVDHIVDYGYIPVSDDWTEEVWLSSQDLDFWVRALRSLESASGMNASDERKKYINMLVRVLQDEIGKPLATETGESIEEYVLRRSGLPIRKHSPLLQYEIAELRRLESCELRRLKLWAGSTGKLLRTINGWPRRKPLFTLAPYPDNCRGITAKGRRVPRMRVRESASWPRLGDKDTYSFQQQVSKGLIRYWLPQEYLP